VNHFSQAAAVVGSQPDALREFGACLLKLNGRLKPRNVSGN
jgi:hypothetical protein